MRRQNSEVRRQKLEVSRRKLEGRSPWNLAGQGSGMVLESGKKAPQGGAPFQTDAPEISTAGDGSQAASASATGSEGAGHISVQASRYGS